MAEQSPPVNPRMHYVVLTVTSSGCLKSISQSTRIHLYIYSHLFPATAPSFLPRASSRSTPAHSPLAKSVLPM